MHCELHLAQCHMSDMVPFRVLFAVRTLKPLVVPLFALRASSCCKHEKGTLSWLNVGTLE